MNQHFDHHLIIRENILKACADLSLAQINTIPEGFNNSIGWNLAHVVVTQQLLLYRMSYNDLVVSDDLVAGFRKGTKPDGALSEEQLGQIKDIMLTTSYQARTDHERGLFQRYKVYETSFGVKLEGIADAIVFNNIHEGMHLGTIKAMANLV